MIMKSAFWFSNKIFCARSMQVSHVPREERLDAHRQGGVHLATKDFVEIEMLTPSYYHK